MNDFLNITYPVADYTATAVDQYIGATAGNITITLPAGILGKTYIIKNETTGTTTVTGTGGQLLDGTANRNLGNNASITVIFRGTQWRII